MTITAERPTTTWQTHPGWGISVDLTPREVFQARRARTHQQLIGVALLLVLVLCAGASLLTRADTATAQRDYDQEQARTSQLAAEASDYAPVVTMQTVTTQLQSDLAVVMAPDVDVVNLLARIKASIPAGLVVSTEAVLLTPPVVGSAPAPAVGATDPTGATTAPTGTSTEVTSTGAQVIGSVNISGTGPEISDVTPFVSALNGLRGVVDVLPVSVTQGTAGMNFTISLNITEKLYTHRYDQAGAK